MLRNPFAPIRGRSEDLDRIQDRLVSAFDALTAAINANTGPSLSSFVSLGFNGVGSVSLQPVKDAQGNVIRRASVGGKLVAAVDVSGINDLQASFEPTLSVTDQIRQVVTTNLSATKILFVVAS